MTDTINNTMSDNEARDVWAALPIREAYPIGSEWHHVSTGTRVVTIAGYAHNDTYVVVNVEDGRQGEEWVRGALDRFGTPRGVAYGETAPTFPDAAQEAPYVPTTYGERVRVTALPERFERWSIPASLLGSVVTYESTDARDTERHYLVRDPENAMTFWVKDVARVDDEATVAVPFTQEDVDRLKREAKREGRAEASREFEAWKQTAQEVAHQYAYDNSLCSEFDRCMIAIGLEPRDSFEREYSVTVTHEVTITARPDDSDAIRQAAMEAINNGWTSPEFDWEEV